MAQSIPLAYSYSHYSFPETPGGDDGFLAIGGDLSPACLIKAYSSGIFPWYNPGEIIRWYCPRERFVIFPQEIHVSRSTRKALNKNDFDVKINSNFPAVIRNCRIQREGHTWIGDDCERAFNLLFRLGYAISVEVYDFIGLVGGLYGVVLGKCFFGESMFSKKANASKIALVSLSKKLADEGFVFIDCQFHTNFLEQMGGRYITWEEYKALLTKGIGHVFT